MKRCSNPKCDRLVNPEISRTDRTDLCAMCYITMTTEGKQLAATTPEQHLGKVKRVRAKRKPYIVKAHKDTEN